MGYRDLLKEATRLKRAKRYEEAIATLRTAFESAREGEYVDIRERLRLPVYLCFVDRDDEAWGELNRLASTYLDPISQIVIRSKMAKFLEDEGRLRDAIFFYAWCYVLDLQLDIEVIKEIHHQADLDANKEPLKLERKDGSVFELDFRRMDMSKTPFAYTENGNPIFDVAHNHILKSLNKKLEIESVEEEFYDLCERLNKPFLPAVITNKIISIIEIHDDTGEWVGELKSFLQSEFNK